MWPIPALNTPPHHSPRGRIFSRKSRHALFLLLGLLLSVSSISGCGGSSSDPITRDSRLLVISDVHFNPFYDPSIFDDLLNFPAEQWPGIFESSSVTAPPPYGNETNYPLLELALSAAQREADGSALVIFPGDILCHKFREKFFDLYGAEDEEALKSFAYKTMVFFAQQVRERFGGVPVAFALGNNDSYAGDYNLEAGGEFLADTATLFYQTLLLGAADPTEFYRTYWDGGYYTAEPPGARVLLICLNTVLFSRHREAGDSGADETAADRQLDWLERNLAEARARDKKVWLVMHIPPGADIFSTVEDYMDNRGHLSNAVSMWKEEYHDRFLGLVKSYREVIASDFAGHSHMDEYRLLPGGDAEPGAMIIVAPAVTPLFGNDPAFKILRMRFGDWELLDYRSLALDLDYPAAGFETLYEFSRAYKRQGPLNQALSSLYPDLSENPALGQTYAGYYYSGRDSSAIITPVNWPAYWCGIAVMEKKDYTACVNSYR